MLGFSSRAFHRGIPYKMFDREHYGLEAKNAHILERVYYKGQANVWDGKEVLGSLLERFGKPQVPEETKRALKRVFAIILWGELAAWRISAELADEIEPLEAKMAATSQAFDEARHFYVMHDYLQALDATPDRLDWGPRRLLEEVMNADHLAKKLLGMQLMVEPIALTLFHVVKKLDIEPVLTHLLPYYERDESRHVALGVQYLPAMLSRMSALERAELWAFQAKLLTYEVVSNYWVANDLYHLGINPRELLDIGKAKQFRAMELVVPKWGQVSNLPSFVVGRYVECMGELSLPAGGKPLPLRERVGNAWRALRHGGEPVTLDLIPEIPDDAVPLIHREQEKPAKKARLSVASAA